MNHRAVLIASQPRSSRNIAAPPHIGGQALTGILTTLRFFRFRHPIRVTDREKDGLWIHEGKPLNLLAYVETRQGSWRVFARKFEATWDWIVKEKDTKLTSQAQKLKRAYLETVESVDPLLSHGKTYVRLLRQRGAL